MKKIVFLINSLSSGGAEKVLSLLIKELSNKQKVELICLEKNNFYTLPKNVKVTYLTSNTGNQSSLIKLIQLPILALKLKKHIRENNILLLQSHVYRANYINILSKLLGSKHEVQIVNAGAISRYQQEGFSGKINLFLINRLYNYADLIILKAKGMQIDMQKLFTFTNKKIVINNPYDIEHIEILKNEDVVDFIFDKTKKYIINIGRFETFKRQDVLIRTLKGISSDIELLLIGGGEKESIYKKIAIDNGVSERVHFIGKVKNPYKYLSKCDIFILSSEDGEGFPNALVEAMICKTLVISSDCVSGPREILAPSTNIENKIKNRFEIAENGILFPVMNTIELTNAINYVLNNSEECDCLIQNAYNRTKDFSLDTIVKQYKEILKGDL